MELSFVDTILHNAQNDTLLHKMINEYQIFLADDGLTELAKTVISDGKREV